MDSYREQGRDALKTVLKQQKNIETIERNIFNKIKSSSDPQKEYKIVIFQVIGDIHNGVELKEILGSIKNNKVGWNHDSYNEMANKIVEQNEFIRNPFEVEEGVFQCKACGSKMKELACMLSVLLVKLNGENEDKFSWV
jgi:hypothetical protein